MGSNFNFKVFRKFIQRNFLIKYAESVSGSVVFAVLFPRAWGQNRPQVQGSGAGSAGAGPGPDGGEGGSDHSPSSGCFSQGLSAGKGPGKCPGCCPGRRAPSPPHVLRCPQGRGARAWLSSAAALSALGARPWWASAGRRDPPGCANTASGENVASRALGPSPPLGAPPSPRRNAAPRAPQQCVDPPSRMLVTRGWRLTGDSVRGQQGRLSPRPAV